MEKEFATYEQALALKELGFDEPCFGRWLVITEWEKPTGNIKLQLGVVAEDYDKKQWNAPLYQQAFRFFREKYGLCACISLTSMGDTFGFDIMLHNFSIERDEYPIPGSYCFLTYEQAEQACLDKLIEIAKQQKNEN